MRHYENLLIALEMYRIEEEKAVKRITNFLTAHGIDISETAVKDSNVEELKSIVSDISSKKELKEEQQIIMKI